MDSVKEIAAALSATEARTLTDEIKGATERLYSLLLRAHEGQAWLVLGYDSWRDYATAEFGMSQSQAYRLLDHGRVIREIETGALDAQADSPIGERDHFDVPTESQSRELAPLLDEPEKLRATWAEANRTTGGKPTAAAVRTARAQVAPHLAPPARPTPSPRPASIPAPLPIETVEIVDAEIVDDSRRDAELNALMAETDVRFRAAFSGAMAKADDVWTFDIARIADVYGNPADRQRLAGWLREMSGWCDRVSEALNKTTVLRSVGGGR